MAKTYIPGAVNAASFLHKYLSRYQATLVNGQTTQRLQALTDLIACLATFLQEWHKPPPNP